MTDRERRRPNGDDDKDNQGPLGPERGEGGGRKKRQGGDPIKDIIDEIGKDDTLKKRQEKEQERVKKRKEKSGE